MVEKDISGGMVYQTTLSTKYRGGRGGITIGLKTNKKELFLVSYHFDAIKER